MKISVLLPIYGSSQWLEEAIDSVVAQDSEQWFLHIADDGSDLETHEWLEAKLI